MQDPSFSFFAGKEMGGSEKKLKCQKASFGKVEWEKFHHQTQAMQYDKKKIGGESMRSAPFLTV